MNDNLEFCPQWASPPGDTIVDLLDKLELTQEALAARMEVSEAALSNLISGRIRLTTDMASRLAVISGSTQSFWLNRDRQYLKSIQKLPTAKPQSSTDIWLRDLPIKEMIRYGWISARKNNETLLNECLDFFAVRSFKEWKNTFEGMVTYAAFRTSIAYDSNLPSISVWLRQGELEARRVKINAWNPKIFRSKLEEVKKLTRNHKTSSFYHTLKELCAESGVALVVLTAPSGCRACGATRFLSDGTPILQLSHRYKTDDQFWFSFFHEAGHLLLHNKRMLFLEDGNYCNIDEEKEANDFAAELLIPKSYLDEMAILPAKMKPVIALAYKIGICPGILVGQMQHKGMLKYNQLNYLKRKLNWTVSTL